MSICTKTYTLLSGDRFPAIGLGCWQSPDQEVEDAVAHALKVGYRHIDGATIYGNEEAVGRGLAKSGVSRSEVWVTTKLWNTEHDPSQVRPALEASLSRLGLDYLDLWLMHYPCAMDGSAPSGTFKVLGIDYCETWKAMEACVDAGLVRNIGVSNFSRIELERLLSSCRIKPAVHQLERHPYLPQRAFTAWHKEIGLHISAYTPLGNTNPSFADRDPFPPALKNPTVVDLAEKHGVSPANILIGLQLAEGQSVLPKSVTPARITENIRDVELSEQDVAELNKAFEGKRYRYCDFSDLIGYKYYEGLDDSD